jgi:hypothetical protein
VALSPKVKRPGREADHSPTSSADVKEWSHTSTSPVCVNGAARGQPRLRLWCFKWAPCHRGMTRPQVADGEDGVQIWRRSVNMLNK